MEKQYYNHINLLRGIAALLVCVFHFTTLETAHGHLFEKSSVIRIVGNYGYTGVFIFFVLSGFVIPLALQQSVFTIKKLPRFLARRYVRIELPYIFSILLIFLVAFIFAKWNGTDFRFEVDRFIYHLLYIVSFTKYEWYNDIYWTLAIEIQFYIFMALSFVLLKKGGLVSFVFLMAMVVLSCFIPDRRFVLHFMPCFAAGIGCWLLKQNKVPTWMFIALMITCLGAAWYKFEFQDGLVILLSILFILYIPEMKNQKFTIGKISYSLYLTHGVIGGNLIYLLVHRFTGFWEHLGIFLLAIAVSVFFAYIYYRLIEKPSQDISKKIES